MIARVQALPTATRRKLLKGTALHVPRAAMGEAGRGRIFLRRPDRPRRRRRPTAAPIGTIKAVQNFGAGDLLEIAFDGSGKTEFVAFTDANVPTVDIAAGRVVVIMPIDDGSKPEDEPKESDA